MGLFDDVPYLGEAEDAAGTVATGAVDTFVADPGNALLGVNADNMGIFEENAAGSKTVSLLTLGLGGEGGLLSDVLMPGQGAPGETPEPDPTEPEDDDDLTKLAIVGGAVAVAAAGIGWLLGGD